MNLSNTTKRCDNDERDNIERPASDFDVDLADRSPWPAPHHMRLNAPHTGPINGISTDATCVPIDLYWNGFLHT